MTTGARPPAPPSGRPPGPMDQSGIFAIKTGFLRVTQAFRRPRKRARPPWKLSLVLLAAAALLGAGATLQRESLDRRFSESLRHSASLPFEIKQARRDLADLEADEKTLASTLDARMKYAESVGSEDFFIVLDTAKKRFRFQYGDRVVREAPAEPGPGRTIQLGSERWTFAPLSGAYSIREKLQDAAWKPPAWVYAMNGKKPPAPLPSVPSGLGRFVIVLSGDAVIHSPPPADSPLKTVKPGSFQVPEADLAAVWKRVGPRTRVYVF